MTNGPSIHANCVVIGEDGVLIRGPSGSGKSVLSEALIAAAHARGLHGSLVSDDRTLIEATHGRLVASAPPALAGLIERRGLGVSETSHFGAARVRLVVDLQPKPDRMAASNALDAIIRGICVARIAAPAAQANQAVFVVFGALENIWRRLCVHAPLAFAAQHGTLMLSAPHAPPCGTPSAAKAAGGVPDTERNEFCAETA